MIWIFLWFWQWWSLVLQFRDTSLVKCRTGQVRFKHMNQDASDIWTQYYPCSGPSFQITMCSVKLSLQDIFGMVLSGLFFKGTVNINCYFVSLSITLIVRVPIWSGIWIWVSLIPDKYLHCLFWGWWLFSSLSEILRHEKPFLMKCNCYVIHFQYLLMKSNIFWKILPAL